MFNLEHYKENGKSEVPNIEKFVLGGDKELALFRKTGDNKHIQLALASYSKALQDETILTISQKNEILNKYAAALNIKNKNNHS